MKRLFCLFALMCGALGGVHAQATLKMQRELVRPIPALGQDVIVTIQLFKIRDVAAGGATRKQDSILGVRQLVSMRSHHDGTIRDGEKRTHAPIICWGTRPDIPGCRAKGKAFNGEMVPSNFGGVTPAMFRYNPRHWQEGDAITVHTQYLTIGPRESEGRLQVMSQPVMKTIPLRQVLAEGREGRALNQIVTVRAGDRVVDFLYNVRATPAR